MMGLRPILLLRTFAFVSAASSSSPSRGSRQVAHGHAVLRREGNATVDVAVEPDFVRGLGQIEVHSKGNASVNASIAVVNASAVQLASNQSLKSDVRAARQNKTRSGQEHQERALLSRVWNGLRRFSGLQRNDPEPEEEEEEEEIVLDAATGLPIPKECRHSFIKVTYCDVKMWPTAVRQAAGIHGNYRFQCDVSEPYRIDSGGGVDIYPKFERGGCQYTKLLKTGEELPRYGIIVNQSCRVQCDGFKYMGFQYMKPSVPEVGCNLKPSKFAKKAAEDEEGLEEGDGNAFLEDGNESEPVELHAGFGINLATACETNTYIYLYIALALAGLGFMCTMIATLRQYVKMHRNRDSDEW